MAGTKIRAVAPIVKVGGEPLQQKIADELLSMRVDREVGLIGRVTLRFRDFGYAISQAEIFALGKPVIIQHPNAGNLIEATVTGISLEQGADNAVPQFVVIADDAAYKLTRGTTIKAHLNASYSTVVQELISKHGLSPEVDSVSGTNEYLLQAGSDLEYLNAITARCGLSWWVDGPKTVHVKKLKPAAPALKLTMEEELESFSVRASGLRPSKLTVNGWNPDTQVAVVGNNEETPAAAPDLLKKYVGAGPAGQLSAAEASASDLPPADPGEANLIAKSLYEDWAAAAIIAEGICDATDKIKPGVTVEVADAGPASGKYLVTGVEHVFAGLGDYTTRFISGGHRPSGLVDTLGAPAPDPGFLISGLVIAVVTDNADPDNAGRVKVKYSAVNGEIDSPWARVVTLGAGADRGIVFEPEVHDEVLVGFERGDTRRPVVIGGLHSKKFKLPTGSGSQAVAAGQVNFRRITSREGHFIELGDGKQPTEQHILMQLGTKKQKLRLGADRFDIELIAGTPATIKAGATKFDISEAGDITIEANNISIKAKATMTLESEGAMSIKAQGNGSLQSTGPLSINGSSTVTVQGGGPVAVKGTPVAIN